MIVSFDTIMPLPNYKITKAILNSCSQISQLIGKSEGLRLLTPSPQLRKENSVKSIQGSLSIEGNALSIEQVSAIFDEKKVIGPAKDILEVQNAILAYQLTKKFIFSSLTSFLKAHKILMNGLIAHAGKWRQKGIGVVQGNRIVHLAPPASRVPFLMADLFNYLRLEKKPNLLLLSCVAHYEIEFIHPFPDGNGRMGRLWQHVMLTQHHPFFEFLPVESIIKKYQKAYYQALHQSDKAGESSRFIEFCLEAILESIEEMFATLKISPMSSTSRLELAKNHFQKRFFSRKDYLIFFKNLSTATASRDLLQGVQENLLQKKGEKVKTLYRYV